MKSMLSRRRKHPSLELNMTPLIDVALTLLIIFLVAAPMMNNAIRIDLPQGKMQEAATKSQDTVVYLAKDGKIFLNKDSVSNADALIGRLKKCVGTCKDKTVFVKADKGVHYGTVIELVDKIKSVGGVHYVALATERAV
jgi:biopolymer transport protein ExbD